MKSELNFPVTLSPKAYGILAGSAKFGESRSEAVNRFILEHGKTLDESVGVVNNFR